MSKVVAEIVAELFGQYATQIEEYIETQNQFHLRHPNPVIWVTLLLRAVEIERGGNYSLMLQNVPDGRFDLWDQQMHRDQPIAVEAGLQPAFEDAPNAAACSSRIERRNTSGHPSLDFA